MATLNVPGTYSSIRAALIAAGNGDTIQIASGSFDITAAGYNNSLTYSAVPNSSTGFINGVTTLTYSGAGNSNDASITTVTGNARLFQKSTDGTPPVSVTYRNLDFLYSGASGYILQTGDFGVSEANTLTKTIAIDNLSFRGTHAGTASASGNYSSVLGIRNFSFNNSIVSLTGQSGFTGTQANSGGSSFLMLSGGQGTGGAINIASNNFDESGYRNALSIFDSRNVTLTSNTFTRSTATTRFVRSGSNKISNSTATNVSSNTFQDGSYLTLAGGDGTLTSNTFNGTNIASGSSGPIGIRLEASPSLPAYTYNSNVFYLVAPFFNASTTVATSTNATLQNTFLNPYGATNTPAAFRSYLTGTNNSIGDTLTGSNSGRDFFSGQLGNDTIDGGAGGTPAADIDFILFNTTPNVTSNVDTILNYTSSAGTTDQLVLDRTIFTNIFTETLNTSGNVVSGLNGRGRVRPADVVSRAGGVATDTNQRIIVDSTGAGPVGPGGVYYDVDGSGSAAAIPFARVSLNSGTTWITAHTQLGNILVI